MYTSPYCFSYAYKPTEDEVGIVDVCFFSTVSDNHQNSLQQDVLDELIQCAQYDKALKYAVLNNQLVRLPLYVLEETDIRLVQRSSKSYNYDNITADLNAKFKQSLWSSQNEVHRYLRLANMGNFYSPMVPAVCWRIH